MACLSMPWGGDLVMSPAGGLALATGQDGINQMITRELLTTSNVLLANGVRASPEFYLLPGFGRSLRVLVGQTVTEDLVDRLTQEITSVVLTTPGVDPNVPPTIQVTPVGHAVVILVSYSLSNGQPASVAFQVGATT
jgi:hypothetical protein